MENILYDAKKKGSSHATNHICSRTVKPVRFFEKSFVLEVFEPATMFRLTNNGISNVYSYDSLGYKDKKLSLVNIGVIISPINATINGILNRATFF